jgi:hypothetical protein
MKKYFFTLLLPIIWATVSFVSYYHPGDEYGMYVYSSIIGTWLFFFVKNIRIQSIFFPIAVALTGGIAVALIALCMDRLRVNRWLWLVCWIVFSVIIFIFSINQYPTIEKALYKHGSWMAYITFSLNVALYVSIFFSVIMHLIMKKYRITAILLL